MNRAGVIALALAIGLTGCAVVRPWDRDLLAQEKMQLVPDPAERAIDEKIYFSKEGSSGGAGIGGGGCGCN